jgi:rubredoxin
MMNYNNGMKNNYEYRVYCPNCRASFKVIVRTLTDTLFPLRCQRCGYIFTRIDGYKKLPTF